MSERSRDEWYRIKNALMRGAYNNFGPVWSVIQAVGPLEHFFNRALINQGLDSVPARPYRLSMKEEYTSIDTLLDKTYSARELPGVFERRESPDAAAVAKLFERDTFIEDEKSTVFFAYVAQWFTDGFLRSVRATDAAEVSNISRNPSTHEVDMAQVYGLTTDITEMLRDRAQPHLLAHQVIDGEEYPPNLFDTNGNRVEQFKDLPVIGLDQPGIDKQELLAMGSDTSNTQIGYAMINTLMMREHNRVARIIKSDNPTWSDDRIFWASRSVLIVVLIKVLIEDYIRHISPYKFVFKLDPQGFEHSSWHRPNWVAVEFNLLYRWHSLVPSTFRIGGQDLDLQTTTMYHTKSLLTGRKLGPLFEDASLQAAGRIGLRNTIPVLIDRVELASINEARDVRLRSYNDYLTRYKFPRARKFSDISSDPEIAETLEQLYDGNVDDVEFYIGLFAADTPKHSIIPALMERMLAIHAFSQLLTNPLLAPQVYNSETFSAVGLEMINATSTFKQIVQRNVPHGSPDYFVSLTRKGWKG
jgi:prostaglandin-endoperoxide synthase 2